MCETLSDPLSSVLISYTHLSKSLCIYLCGCGNNDSLSPLWSKEVLQISLEGLQAGKFLREVYWCNTWMGGISVQLLLQRFVDLIEGTQQELSRNRGTQIYIYRLLDYSPFINVIM